MRAPQYGTVFQQILRAKEMGFQVRMNYLAAGPVEEHIRRVMNRAALGGHSTSERKLREIYDHSMKHLLIAFEENRNQAIDLLRVLDNSGNIGYPRVSPEQLASEIPPWLETALEASSFNIPKLRAAMRSRLAE